MCTIYTAIRQKNIDRILLIMQDYINLVTLSVFLSYCLLWHTWVASSLLCQALWIICHLPTTWYQNKSNLEDTNLVEAFKLKVTFRFTYMFQATKQTNEISPAGLSSCLTNAKKLLAGNSKFFWHMSKTAKASRYILVHAWKWTVSLSHPTNRYKG